MFYQMNFNGIRLGLYQVCTDKGWNRGQDGNVHRGKTLLLASTCGALGGFTCSPFYLVSQCIHSKYCNTAIKIINIHTCII